jgi:hypothetical protein
MKDFKPEPSRKVIPDAQSHRKYKKNKRFLKNFEQLSVGMDPYIPFIQSVNELSY